MPLKVLEEIEQLSKELVECLEKLRIPYPTLILKRDNITITNDEIYIPIIKNKEEQTLKTTVEIKNKEDFLEKAQKLKNLFDEINTIISELGLKIELK